ncbi:MULTISPECIES: amidohydrolase [Rhizobium]|uniref:Aminobenzoyl-glutamate utilization protein B n=1 Tax=Rhizobium binae TaxID=1138190 RepID=A0ABV2MLY7_9HYPH|nr:MULTISPECIES: amidohydrolase [Rhizobium]NKL49665.1 amidohydrolase [Rhizobium leguminosarum bv. viciae]MBX4936993.1 amidohydrolase [Rhizobium binae]MBX4943643.1 amidohydrolase [Rhizobium binae]MBX4979087.1 amidohydrolase [Rhizobium binae]MBX4995824.1 amidohydrolase [Rhizobium binae]
MRNDHLALDEVSRHVDAKASVYCALSDRIWAMPELAFEEHQSVAEQCAILEREGFRITRNAGDVPTAFVAEYGEGGPVIGILGEYDALPELSQVSGALKQEPLTRGGSGHGCGHNLLGAGSALAAAALKEALSAEGIAGTVRYYGCPAEENGGGKTYMARAGLFDDVDVAFCWHPNVVNEVHATSSLAEIQVYFRFHGRATHAAMSPHMGRSALDAVELMNVGVNYMREHMPSDARVHYAVTNTGGDAPNTVQAYAESFYSIRSPLLPDAQKLVARVRKIAEGAAMMTETSVVVQIAGGSSNIIPNNVLQEVMYDNMSRIGPPRFDEADITFAQKLREASMTVDGIFANIAHRQPSLGSKILHDDVLALPAREEVEMGTTDVGDVSWIAPTVQCHTACYAIGTEFHTWQMVTQGNLPAAHKGMVLAARVIAASAADCLRNPTIIARAKAELENRLGTHTYDCPIPPDVTPDHLRKKPA